MTEANKEKRKAPPVPALPEETIATSEVVLVLGGPVRVRGLLLRDRLDLAISKGFNRVAIMLASCVVDEDGEPLYSAGEWERFGGLDQKRFDIAMDLWTKAQDLSGLTPPVEGKAKPKN